MFVGPQFIAKYAYGICRLGHSVGASSSSRHYLIHIINVNPRFRQKLVTTEKHS